MAPELRRDDPRERLFSLFVILYRLHENDREPIEPPTAADVTALTDILKSQCRGDAKMARAVVREMFKRPEVEGASLHKRYRSWQRSVCRRVARIQRRRA